MAVYRKIIMFMKMVDTKFSIGEGDRLIINKGRKNRCGEGIREES